MEWFHPFYHCDDRPINILLSRFDCTIIPTCLSALVHTSTHWAHLLALSDYLPPSTIHRLQRFPRAWNRHHQISITTKQLLQANTCQRPSWHTTQPFQYQRGWPANWWTTKRSWDCHWIPSIATTTQKIDPKRKSIMQYIVSFEEGDKHHSPLWRHWSPALLAYCWQRLKVLA